VRNRVIIAYYGKQELPIQMSFAYFSHDGTILPIEQAVIPLSSVEYSYGFGVYETVRRSKGTTHFLAEHCVRLLNSAKIIDLAHNFSADFVARSVQELVVQNNTETCNLKILLIGSTTPETASLYIICLNPLFPDRKLYSQGATAITYACERAFPQAKTLNMLPSYLAYRRAKQAGAYDALLVNRHMQITEGTRTNLFALRDRTIISPPAGDILLGVTRDHVLKVALENNFEILEQPITLTDLDGFGNSAGALAYDNFFLTSTSAKIMPLRSIDNHMTGPLSAPLQELMQAFNHFLETQN
jgi:branched-subunit amino acid aminotransferase/4-amino-4-deoxychorismate lyase